MVPWSAILRVGLGFPALAKIAPAVDGGFVAQ